MIFLRLIGSDKAQGFELLFTTTILDTAMQNFTLTFMDFTLYNFSEHIPSLLGGASILTVFRTFSDFCAIKIFHEE